MKILVLMPLDERSVYMAARLYAALPDDVKEHTFAMPMFMEYLVEGKIAANWAASVFQTIIAARSVYRAAKDDDLIVIGNINQDYKFDAIFNFQDAEKDEPYVDVFVDKLSTIDDDALQVIISNLYSNEDSKMPLHNCKASGDFLGKYIKTDPHLKKLEEEYQKIVKDQDERIIQTITGK